MNILTIIIIAIGLAMDAFAVSVATGATYKKPTGNHALRMAFAFGAFQAIMPLAGWLAGLMLREFIKDYDHWVAFILLAFIGGKMIYEGIAPQKEETECSDPTKGLSLVMLALATSIDALGVGFSLGVLGQSLFFSAVCIGITAGGMTWMAMKLGNKLSERFAHRMEIFGGGILLVIAFKLLFF